MKRKIAILLATVMTAAVLPMNVMASSSNTINKSVTVAVDDYITDVYLKIQPNDEITSEDAIELTLTNAEFFTDDDDNYNPKQWSDGLDNANGGAYTWETANEAYNTVGEATLLAGDKLFGNDNNTLPYKIKKNDKRSIEVKLFRISDSRAGVDNDNGVKPYYYIPLQCRATDEGDVQVTINANESSISGGGTYTIASSTDTDGSTTTTIAEVNFFEDSIYLEDITIKENVKGTFEDGIVKLRLSGGFVFDDIERQDEFAVSAGMNADFADLTTADIIELDEDELTFQLPSALIDSEKAASFKIVGLKVITDDEDKWGDVNLTISGANITKETIKVAERADYGFGMTLEEEVPTIYAGRFYVANNDIDEDDNQAAEVLFSELIENTYLTERKLEFSVPEGIKIVDYEINDPKRFSNFDDKITITEDGTVLKIDKGVEVDDSDISEFKLKLWISADADFSGDVALSVKGAGVGEGVVEDVVIAKIATPITITAEPTVTNMGYQAIQTSDITITEATDGILLKDEEVRIELDAAFGEDEIGFSDDVDLDYEITGDLQVKGFDVEDGAITFTVDKTSYTEPSSITIKNVAIGSTRSVPYGAYDLKVFGSAVINNFDEDKEDEAEYPAVPGEEFLGYFDTTDAYSFADYLTINTVTGTFDDVVEVTIGETACTVNGQAYDMDVAPYIQASSNSTMVPLRFVSIALGVDSGALENPDESDRVVWNANTKTVTLYYGQGTGQKIVQFTAGSNNMVVDGNAIAMDYGVTAEITNDRMFVPFRALGNALGIKVTWNADTKTATYSAY